MKCPACVEAGLTSRIDVHRVAKQPMPVERFYDEDGALHVHDHLAYKTVFTCTNGHGYQQVAFSPCPSRMCSWNQQTGWVADHLLPSYHPAPRDDAP